MTYDLDKVNAERRRRHQRELTRAEADSAARRADPGMDLSSWLITWAVLQSGTDQGHYDSGVDHGHGTSHDSDGSSYDSGGGGGSSSDSSGGGGGSTE